MSAISVYLTAVHDFVHDSSMKHNFSEPKIYSGGVDLSKWNAYSKAEQKTALDKEWYVYHSFRHPETKKLVRQSNIKYGANNFKTKNERSEVLKSLQRNLMILLKNGFNPYEDNTERLQMLQQKNKKIYATSEITETVNNQQLDTVVVDLKEYVKKKPEKLVKVRKVETAFTGNVETQTKSINDAFEFGLNLKKNVLTKTSFDGFKGRANRFLKWIDINESATNTIETISKKIVINYLNEVLQNTSATNRNNTRTDLSSLFQTLVDNEILSYNFIKDINVLKSKPERNKSYSVNQVAGILEYMHENDKILLLFIQFITYNFLRPVEVCRLKVGDLDIEGKKVFLRAKNKAVKIKILPQKILALLPDLSQMDKSYYLFTPDKIGGIWETEENNRRDYFSKRFKVVKDHFNLDKDYGLYSFRHTAIGNLYREINKINNQHVTKGILMNITGHQTIEALDKYLRDIDAELPEDYSEFL